MRHAAATEPRRRLPRAGARGLLRQARPAFSALPQRTGRPVELARLSREHDRAVKYSVHRRRAETVAQRGIPSAAQGRGVALAVRPCTLQDARTLFALRARSSHTWQTATSWPHRLDPSVPDGIVFLLFSRFLFAAVQ